MINNRNQPRPDDTVLGGQSLPQVSGAVLGGLEGVKQRLASSVEEQRVAALSEAMKYVQEGLDLVIQALKDESQSVQQAAYSLLEERFEFRIKQALQEHDSELLSDLGMDYKHLRKLLAARKWEKADQETLRLMLHIVGEDEEEGCFTEESIQNFPSTDLRTIDQLWVRYSNGRFGFSVQKRIWQSTDGDCYSFAEHIGWRDEGEKDWREDWNDTDWLYYDELTFNLRAPEGHLPVLWRDWMEDTGFNEGYYFDLFSRKDL